MIHRDHTRRLFWTRGVVAVAAVVFPVTADSSREKFHRETLVVAIAGINDSADNDLAGMAASISPTAERFIIVQGGETFERLPEGSPERSVLRPMPSVVKKENIIRIDDPNSARSIELLRKIAQTPNATVMIDVAVGLEVGEKTWAPHTRWAAAVATTLGENHLAAHPASRMALVGHSLGTEPMAQVPAHLFPGRRYALSPRTAEGHPPGTTFVVADGDFFYNPKGRVTRSTVFETMGPAEAESLAAAGQTVIRLAGERPNSGGFDARNASYLTAFTAEMLAREAALRVDSALDRPRAHTSVAKLNEPGLQIFVYPDGGGPPTEIAGTSIANVIRRLDQARPADAASNATPSHAQLEQMAEAARQSEPTPGLGGISMNQTATIDIDPRSVSGAEYDANEQGLRLVLHDGRTLRFPAIDPTILQQAFYFAYVKSAKPELSIGGTQFVTPDRGEVTNVAPLGKHPVHYLGGSEGTSLGLAMFSADETLGLLAFTDDAALRSVTAKVPGFRSLPQLYPEKYTLHPGAQRYIGEQRVFLTPSVVEYVLTPGADALDFGTTRFSVRFAHLGPAEMAFSAFLESHFDEVAGTDVGASLQQLTQYARALAAFRWLRENGIPMQPGTLLAGRGRPVLTPRFTAQFPTPSISAVTRPYPIASFGRFGPRQIFDEQGRESEITYKNGLVIRARRADGSALDVFRDGLGHPFAIRRDDGVAGAFRLDDDLGLVFLDNVQLTGSGPNVTFAMTDRSRVYAESRPEETVQRAVVSFLDVPSS